MSFPGGTLVTGPRSLLGEGVPQSRSKWGYPSQVQLVGRGYHWLGLDGGIPPVQEWGAPLPEMGYPQFQGWGIPHVERWGTPRMGQQMEYLIRSGWYASCVHAGGLSCPHLISKLLPCIIKRLLFIGKIMPSGKKQKYKVTDIP